MRRCTAVLVLSLTSIAFLFQHYLGYQGIPTDSFVLSELLLVAAGGYLVGSAVYTLLPADESAS